MTSASAALTAYPESALEHQERCSLDAAIDRVTRLVEAAMFPLDVDVPRLLSAVLGCHVTDADLHRRARQKEAACQRLAALLADPGIPQRTPEWYAARNEMITASDFAQALGCAKFGTLRQFFEKKCGHSDPPPFNPNVPPLRWGIMLEPVACSIYARLNAGVRVHEFGLLRHPVFPFLGASPDGITEQGVLLEIKCPWRRRIGAEVPLQYYYQIQGQLEVCGLDACDYFECEFECATVAAAVEDAAERGVLVETVFGDGRPHAYRYPPPATTPADDDLAGLQAWADAEERDARLQAGVAAVNVVWWRLSKSATVRVTRDPAFVRDMVTRLADVWARVLRYRGDKAAYAAEAMCAAPSSRARGTASAVAAPRQQAEADARLNSGFAFVPDEEEDMEPSARPSHLPLPAAALRLQRDAALSQTFAFVADPDDEAAAELEKKA